MTGSKRHRRAWLALGALLLAWGAVALWLAPALIRDAYAERSLPILNDIFEGRDQHSVERYLDSWRAMSLGLTLLLVGLGAIAYGLVRFRGALRARASEIANGLPLLPLRTVLALAVPIGFLAGVGEVLVTYVRVRNSAFAFSWRSLAEAPLAAIASLLVIGLLLALAARLSRRDLPLRLAPALFAFLAIFGWLYATRVGLHSAALALLALGFATQLVRPLTRRLVVVRKLSWGASLAAITVMVVVAVGLPLQDMAREQRANASLPDASRGAPNVLLLILDTVRAANLSLYGYHRETTPNLERLAQNGVVFERAVATSPWTLPSHASLFTGRYHHEVSADWHAPLDDRHPTLAEELRERGYLTAGFVANRSYASRASGLARGFSRYEDQQNSLWLTAFSWGISREFAEWLRRRFGDHAARWRTNAEEINGRFLRWLSKQERRPFFAFLNYMDAHDPYLVPDPFNLTFSETQPRYWVDFMAVAEDFTPEEVSQLVDAYDGALAYLDHQLGRLFAELRARGVLDNTLVIVTSDHGEEFGEHGVMLHGRSLYWPSLHVPLVVSHPGRLPAGLRVSEFVTIRDIPATVMDLATGSTGPFPGHSLGALFGEPGPGTAPRSASLSQVTPGINWPRAWIAARGTQHSVIRDSLHLIRHQGGEEVYDLATDPWERQDLNAGPTVGPWVTRLRAVLDSAVSGSG